MPSLLDDALDRFRRLILPAQYSLDAAWGQAKVLKAVGQRVELVRVGLDIPVLWTCELVLGDVGNEVRCFLEVGLGSAVQRRTFDSNLPTTYNSDPLFSMHQTAVQPDGTIQRIIRFAVWGTSIRLEAQVLTVNMISPEDARSVRCNVVPGASPVVAANIAGTGGATNTLGNITITERVQVAQNVAAVDLVSVANAAAGKTKRGCLIYNNAPANLLVYLDAGGQAVLAGTRESFSIPPQETWEMQFPFMTGVRITGVWAAAGAGNAWVTMLAGPGDT